MILEGRDVKGPEVFEAEAVVVGSGAGGGIIAKELQEHGVQTILFEEGGYYTSADFTQREEEMMPKLYWDAGLTGNRDMSVFIQYGRCAGGSTTHNIGLCFRPEPAILERWREEHGVENASYPELVPYMERVEQHIGVSRIPEGMLNANNLVFKRGADRLGYRGLIPNHNRINCLGAGFCELGCTYDRLQSVLITYLPKANAKGATIVCDARVERVVTQRGKVVRLEGYFLDRESGIPRFPWEARASVFILAAGAIQTPALLARSGIEGFYGKTLRLHPYVPVAALFKERIEAWRGLPQSYVVDEFAHFKQRGYGGFLIITGFAHPAAFANLLPGAGETHFELMRQYPYMAACGAMVHDETKGRVSLARDGRTVVDYFPQREDKRYFMEGLKVMAKIMFAAGAQKVLLPYASPVMISSPHELDVVDRKGIHPRQILIGSVHPQGSCPMGEDPRHAFVNSHGRCHALSNLYVTDTSIFCTSLGTPPQIPTMTFATRTADFILQDMGKKGLSLHRSG